MRPVRAARALLSLFLLAASAPSLLAQVGSIRGRVIDSTGAPLSGTILTVDGTAVRTQAASTGSYLLTGVPAGLHTVRARLIGYLPGAATVTVKAGASVTLEIKLARSAVSLAAVQVVVGSRAQHKAADEVAVPVDIIPVETIAKQGTTELSAIFQNVAPSVNFPRQSVTDADDIVRPFTMRGLSPDHTLVLVNGVRRHRTALVHTFAQGMPAGSNGVDLNAMPASAIERMEVLRDGASAQYGSDAIAGVLNLVIKSGEFSPFINADVGRYESADYPADGNTFNLNGGLGLKVGRGSLGLFTEYRNRQPTNRAWPEAGDQLKAGDADVVDANGKITRKNNPVAQPNHHYGDGLANDLLTFANLKIPTNEDGTSEFYGFGGYTYRIGTGNGFYRQGISERNWPQIYPVGFLPEFRPTVVDWSAASGFRGLASNGWNYDVAASYGYNLFDYQLKNTLNASLGPCLVTACAPGLDGILGNSDDPGIPNSTHFFAGGLRASELGVSANFSKEVDAGLPNKLNVAAGATYRRETFTLIAGEKGSWIQGGHLTQYGDPAPPGSQVFSGFLPSTAADVSRGNTGAYLDLETDLTKELLVNAAARFENYSDFGSKLSSKLAMRFQPSKQVVFRAAVSTGFRAPSLAQSYYGSRITSFKLDPATGKQKPFEVGIFPVNDPAALALGAKPLKAESSVNFSGGMAWSPTDDFNVTFDGYLINLNDRILLTGYIGGDVVEKLLAKRGLAVTAGQYFTNIVDTRTKGIDLTANYHTTVAAGTLTFNTGINYTTNEIVGQRADPVELAGTGATLVDKFTKIQIEKERPDWRGTLTADYSRNRNNVLLRSSYYGSFHSAPGLCDTCDQLFGGKTLFDVEAGRQFGAVHWSIGIRNLLDTYPDKQSADNGYGIFPWAGASPFGYNGRFVYTRAEMILGR